MELLGNKKETQALKYEHYEETFLHNHFTATVASNGDFTVGNDFDDVGDGSGNTAVRDGDIIMGGSGALYYVTAADVDQPNNDFTIKIDVNRNPTKKGIKIVKIVIIKFLFNNFKFFIRYYFFYFFIRTGKVNLTQQKYSKYKDCKDSHNF